MLPIIWFAIVSSLLIYAFVGWFTLRTPRPGSERPWQESLQQPVVLALYIAGVAMFFASLAIPKVIAGRSSGTTQQSPVRQALIVRWALAESIAIFGLVAAFVSGHLELMIPLWLVSLVAVVIAFPSESTIAAMEEH